jgi:hypothetical protein
MKTNSQHPTSNGRKQASALLLAILGGLALLMIAPTGTSQSGLSSNAEGGTAGGSEGGDNPVVGSLPCVVDPTLDLKFFQNANNASAGPLAPVLGLVGPQLCSEVQTASGTPNGRVNRGGGTHTILGLTKSGTIVVGRDYLASAGASLSQWVPDSFQGGSVTMTGSFGYSKSMILSNLAKLPIDGIAASPAVVGDVWFTIQPLPAPGGQSSPPLRVHVVFFGNLATISYLP